MMLEAHIAGKALEAIAGKWQPEAYGQSLLQLFRDHVERRYPGSQHWNPDKISLSRADG